MAWRIGVDTGGTFTDVVAVDESSGRRHVRKTSSTPGDPSVAFSEGIRDLLAEIEVDPGEVSFISHGTTVATNAILESKYARMGLLVTEGYREMLEVARQTVPGDFGDITWWLKPPRVVPLEMVRETAGRLLYTGEEHTPLDEDRVRAVAREYREMGLDALAVSFLHSYRNPEHEQRAKELILEEHPGCFVSISSDVIREYREYERTLSTCLNTGLMPLVSTYISALEDRLNEDGVNARLYVMKSSGGIARAAELAPQPISAVLSGPAAGVVTAAYYGEAAGHPSIITADIGGTSTDICLIDQGTPHMLTEGRIDVFDIKTPMIDMHTVGAGGGSIAWLAAGRSLRVGPQSAGAVPGPVCYDSGGTEPTVTDAHIVLGRVSPYLLGGEIKLDAEAARAAIETKIAEPLGMASAEEAALGILALATTNIAQGINVVSVKRGRDPRDYALMAFGGAGRSQCMPGRRDARDHDGDRAPLPGGHLGRGTALHRRALRSCAHRRAAGGPARRRAARRRLLDDAGRGRRSPQARGLRGRADHGQRLRRHEVRGAGLRGARAGSAGERNDRRAADPRSDQRIPPRPRRPFRQRVRGPAAG